MEPVMLWWQLQGSETPRAPLHLFLSGLTAGVVVVTALADLLGIKSTRIHIVSRLCAMIAAPLRPLPSFFRIAVLGKPERGLAFLLFSTNEKSWMTQGGGLFDGSSTVVVRNAILSYVAVLPYLGG